MKRGETEVKVHERLRPFRVENAPSREYFKIPSKQGSDLAEQALYAAEASEQNHERHELPHHMEASRCSQYNRRRKLVMRARCQRIQATVNGVQTHSAAEHLFLVCSMQCPGMIGATRSSEPHQHVQDLKSKFLWKLEILRIWYGKSDRRDEVYQEFENFRDDCPGGDWFHMNPQPARDVISKVLFDRGDI